MNTFFIIVVVPAALLFSFLSYLLLLACDKDAANAERKKAREEPRLLARSELKSITRSLIKRDKRMRRIQNKTGRRPSYLSADEYYKR